MKNGGWLDNYGTQENYNDYKVSAPKDFKGNGYSNVGRNYSPAWGGQFQEGGEIPMAQNGTKKPIYVESENDPRYKAYNDSLSLYKAYLKQDELMGKGNKKIPNYNNNIWTLSELKEDKKRAKKLESKGHIPSELQSFESMKKHKQKNTDRGDDKIRNSIRQQDIDLVNYYNSLPFSSKVDIAYHTSPDLVHKNIRPIGTYDDGTAYSPIYKKPEQEVIVQRPEIESLQQLAPLQTIGTQIQASLPVIRPEAKIPKSYNVHSQRYNMKGPSEYYDYNREGISLEQLMKVQAVADAYNADVEKRYGPQNEYRTPKSAKDAAERYKQLRQEVDITPNYQMGGNVYPVNYVPQAQEGQTMFKKPSILQQEYIDPIYSYPERDLYPSEDEFLKENTHVGGMAAEDDHVIINPYSPLPKEMKDLVRINETARLAMRNGYPRPTFDLTPKQKEFYSTIQNGKPYSEDLQDIRETIAARIMTGDDSAQDYTEEQQVYADKLADVLERSKEYATGMSGMMKSKIGMGNAFGHPAIKRMSQAMPKTGMTPEGQGTHYMSSVDNYAVPELQDLGEEELTMVDPDSRSREAIRFNSPEEANYFAKHYKEVAPMSTTFRDLNSFQTGGSIPGSVGFTYARTKGIPSNGPYAKKTKASAQDGSQVTENNDWLANWYANRKIPNEQLQSLYEEDKPYYLERLKNIPEVTNVDSIDDDPNITGSYKTDTNQILVTPQARDNVYLHEANHYLNNFPSAMRTVHGNITSANIAPKENLTGVYKDKYDYFSNPDEVHSRIQVLRKKANLQPDEEVTPERLNKFLKTYEGDDENINDLLNLSDTDHLLEMLNYMAYNEPSDMSSIAQNGKEMSYYQNGLDWKPKGMKNGGWLDSYEEGGVIKDDRGQWDHPGEITEINSPYITMQGVPYPVLGVSDTGDVQMMYPEEDYEFDGEKVTEYPMAQRGVKLDFSKGRIGKIQKFIEEAKNKKNNNKINIKERNTTVADKTSVKQNKQKKIVDVPLTEKEMVNNSINNQARFMKDWMNSPMYDEMLDNSTTGYFDKRYLNSGRNSNFNDIKVQLHPQPEDSPNTGASSNSETGLIKLFPLGAKGQALEGMLAHEISHSSDKPRFLNTNSSSKFIPRNKYNNKGIEEEVRLIPEKDINLMKSFYSDNKVYKNLFNKSALKNKDLNEQREWFNYVSEPTETRARLNDIRYNAKKYGIYDPFTQKVTPEILNEIKELTKKAGGFDPFYQLQGVYSDEEILKLLNTVSQNEQPDENPYIATAKNGLRQEQKGLVNLDNLINFTNYNKPESNGWLDKYEDGGTVPPVISKQVNLKQEIPFEKIPTTDNKKIVIDNFSPSYDYIVEGDKTYYKVKGGNSWADISNNTKARKNLLEFLDKNNYWAGYGSGEKAKFDKVKNQPVIVPGGKIPKTTPTIIRNTETGNKPMIVKRPIKKVIEEEPGFFDDVSDFVSSGVDSLEKKWKDVKKEAKHVVKTVGDAVSSGIDNAITTTEDAYHTVMNGIQRKYKTHTGDDDDAEVKTSVNENPKTVKEWYGNKSGAEITQVLDAPNVPGRTYKQQVLPTSNIRFGVRNRGEYKDIKTDGLEVTTFQPFTKNALPDDASVLAIDANGNLHTGQYKEFKGKKDYMFSRTFRNKIIDFPEVNGKGEYVSGAKSGNPKYQQPKVKVLDDNGKVVNGSLNVLVKDDSKKDYYGQVQGGRILFVNPTTKEQYLVSGSISHIKQR
jgi:hypothetical protein